MDDSKINELVYSKKVAEFITVAHEYCIYLEEIEKYKNEIILTVLQKLLPLLYLKGSLLPEIETNDETAVERFVNEEKWIEIFNSIKMKLGKDDQYFITDDDATSEKECTIIKSTISEDLADVYQDLKDFVILYQKGKHSSKEAAVKECKYLFETHWGAKLLNVNRRIHYLSFRNVIIDDSL